MIPDIYISGYLVSSIINGRNLKQSNKNRFIIYFLEVKAKPFQNGNNHIAYIRGFQSYFGKVPILKVNISRRITHIHTDRHTHMYLYEYIPNLNNSRHEFSHFLYDNYLEQSFSNLVRELVSEVSVLLNIEYFIKRIGGYSNLLLTIVCLIVNLIYN